MQELLDLKMWKDMALLDRKLLKIRRSAFYGTPGIGIYFHFFHEFLYDTFVTNRLFEMHFDDIFCNHNYACSM